MFTLRRIIIWLSRIHRCRGFGIQSPTDYAFVRYVINEHWPYYAYTSFDEHDPLRLHLGRLYFRLANWRQPSIMHPTTYQQYVEAGCHKTQFAEHIDTIQLAIIDIDDTPRAAQVLAHTDHDSVIVVEGIHRNPSQWQQLCQAAPVFTSFDLYYCGILLFKTRPYKHHYIINY